MHKTINPRTEHHQFTKEAVGLSRTGRPHSRRQAYIPTKFYTIAHRFEQINEGAGRLEHSNRPCGIDFSVTCSRTRLVWNGRKTGELWPTDESRDGKWMALQWQIDLKWWECTYRWPRISPISAFITSSSALKYASLSRYIRHCWNSKSLQLTRILYSVIVDSNP